MGRAFTRLEAMLGDRPYLGGEAFSVADACAFVATGWGDLCNETVYAPADIGGKNQQNQTCCFVTRKEFDSGITWLEGVRPIEWE